MTLWELFDAISTSAFHHGWGTPVRLYADMEGMSMEPASVSIRTDYHGNPVLLISAWEPDGDEYIS